MKRAFSRKNLWEQAPGPVRAIAGCVLGLVPPAYLLGRAFRDELARLQVAQWWSADEARAYQLARLRHIAALAYQTRYYRGLFDSAGINPDSLTFEGFSTLPRLDRDTLRGSSEGMRRVPAHARGIDYVTTGGTSGKPLQFYIDAGRSQVEFAHLVAGWARAGFSLGTPLAVFRGRAVAATRSGLHHLYERPLRQHFYSSFHLHDDQLSLAVRHLRGIGECFLQVYPSSAATLARYIQRAGLEPPANVRGLLAESEILYPEQRRLIESVFRRRVFSSYGLTEKVAAAAGCESSNDYHFWATYGYVELLDEQGAPVTTPGQRGEITATGFMNTVMPFIRYRTGDQATLVGDRCEACGRAQLVVRDIRGHRVQETLVAGDGSEISWTALNMHDDTFDRIARFQFYQDEPGRAVLRLVPAAGFGPADAARIRQRLAAKIDGRIEVTLTVVSEVALTSSGKAIYVDQRIPAEHRAAGRVSA